MSTFSEIVIFLEDYNRYEVGKISGQTNSLMGNRMIYHTLL